MSQHDPEATPQQQEAVRRLLAEARHAEPLPADVAARLDGVLAQLVAEGPRGIQPPPPVQHAHHPHHPQHPQHPPGAVVVDLAARRRRRRVSALLGAAAAVVVVGVGVGQVVDRSGSDESGSSDAGGSAADVEQGDAEAGPQDESPGSAPAAPGPTLGEPSIEPPGTMGTPSPAPSETESAPLPTTVPTVTSAGFRQAALELRDGATVTAFATPNGFAAADLTSDPLFVCPPTNLGPGQAVAVTYDGSPAVLVYRDPAGDTQTVELLQCGSGEILRSVVVPAR